MKIFDEEYATLFNNLTQSKDFLEEKVDLKGDEYNDWYEENFILDKTGTTIYQCLYQWVDTEFTVLNADDEDIEGMIIDMKEHNCETFADFALFYMRDYIYKLNKFVEAQDEKQIFEHDYKDVYTSVIEHLITMRYDSTISYKTRSKDYNQLKLIADMLTSEENC